ncbi:hypothetical protein VPNG_06793 [Cytospora leucostoma]|uniref:Histidine-specific methyltransferase SAM-dependent domain-containing protein n=1 Tax=Cytospora leucostoma TaxID=1230097 RepID=A0A423WVW9_9PEZI|nr:hypothetical protein VPNG_06793 [Cytospora leucostoma]
MASPSYPEVHDKANVIDIHCEQYYTSLEDLLKRSISSQPPTFPSLLLWDEAGLQRFEAVTYSPDYYLTDCEIELLEEYSLDIARQIVPGSVMLELGSGCLRKIKLLLDALEELRKSVDYYALDLSSSELQRTLSDIHPENFEYVRCHGLLGTYDDGKRWLRAEEQATRPKCILSLGSTIGSEERPEAARFLRSFADAMTVTPGFGARTLFVVGVDGCKSGAAVWRAYNDEGGRNRRFILNLLLHANSILGYDAFDLEAWSVRGEWNEAQGCHDQYLIPKKEVYIEGVNFFAGQKVFVVSSYKYDDEEQTVLWKAAGLQLMKRFRTSHNGYI